MSDSRAPQFRSPKQLSVRGNADGGDAHRDCENTQLQIESPADEQARRDRDGDKVIGVA
jgi:hypothetical protein